MNKTKIKNFSIWARRNLIEVVGLRMRLLGIDESGIKPEMEGSTSNLKLYDMGTSKPAEVAGKDIAKRTRLVNHIKDHESTSDYKTAYETVVEEISYTWFNRLIAIRFMEVNDYLPSGVRVLSSASGKHEPDIVSCAADVAKDQGFSISVDEILKMKDENKLDELFRIMFIQQCKKLHEVLPELFDNSLDDYTELLLPISFIDDDGFIRHLVNDIDEADFDVSKEGQVEIIGWLYQYYNSEKKDAVFAAMKDEKVSKENIAAATQLFTPDWIVRYMVENSLGRIFIDKRKSEGLYADGRGIDEVTYDDVEEKRIETEKRIANEMGWRYYLPEAKQVFDVRARLDEINKGRKTLTPEQIRFIDPCMGSGHILVYAFDVLMQIYLSCGYTERDAAQNIVRNNLWGLDLDKRAYQLAMKARQYDRRFLTRGIMPNLSHFQDLPIVNYSLLDEPLRSFVEQFENADTYGSLITVQADDEIDKALDEFQGTLDLTFGHMEHLMQLYKILSQRYDVVCTNPPYMGSSNMNGLLAEYLRTRYTDYKTDFFSAFVIRCTYYAKRDGYLGFLTPYVWMFIQSYEALRKELYSNRTIETLIQFEYSAFEEATVPICTFAFRNNHIHGKNGCYLRLTEYRGGMEVQKQKALEAISDHNCGYYYEVSTDNFCVIPGQPVAYWVSKNMLNAFIGDKVSKYYVVRNGISTGDNNRYLRLWFELDSTCDYWKPCNKGGSFRKWYGNNEYYVYWKNDGYSIKNSLDEKGRIKARLGGVEYSFSEGVEMSRITSGALSFRYSEGGFIYESTTNDIYQQSQAMDLFTILGYCNTKIVSFMLNLMNPTINIMPEDIRKLPLIPITDDAQKVQINDLVKENITISRTDWDSFETSWDFKEHPFVKWSKELWDATAIGAAMQHFYGDHPKASCPLELCYLLWQGECNDRRAKLKANEEELNRIFIEIYGLQDELTPEVDDKDITVCAADLQRDMRSFVSYAVGCMFGRYSLDTEGLAYAGGEWDESKYKTFIPDKDNCLPITEEAFFEDDIVTQFANFVQAVFGEDTLEDNLRYVAENLGIKGNGTAREKIRQYFLKEFYKDHCKVYQKRPIYWLFDTGKKNGFKALCYVHRWTVNTVGDVRIDYMHKLQKLYRNEIARVQECIDNGDEIGKNQKRLEKLTNQLQETEEYDAKIAIVVAARTEIDLDDGVKKNYEKVQIGSDGKKYDILTKI